MRPERRPFLFSKEAPAFHHHHRPFFFFERPRMMSRARFSSLRTVVKVWFKLSGFRRSTDRRQLISSAEKKVKASPSFCARSPRSLFKVKYSANSNLVPYRWLLTSCIDMQRQRSGRMTWLMSQMLRMRRRTFVGADAGQCVVFVGVG